MHYSLSEFIEQRMIEKKMLTSNGYENGDPKTNGEYHLIEDLGSFCDLFIDIGANIGDFSKKILKLYPDVDIMIFEANKELFIELYKIYNANDNNVFNIALSDKIGEIEFNINRLDSTTSSIFDRTYMMPDFMSNTEKVAVKKATLDSYIERIQLCVKNNDNGMFIKIDTEGAEFSIMLGSQKVFNLERPIFMQFEYGHGWKQVLN